VNIEELELSLRTEFEGQIRSVLAGIKQEVADFQSKFEADFEKHRTELSRTISDLSSKLPETAAFDTAFTEAVNEHLRLARDDGAQVAATAFGEAEKLRIDTTAPQEGFDQIRDAISAISSKNTQATILQSLIEQASLYTSRGAFFVVKNDHLVGWKLFGNGSPADDGRVRDVHFPASADTVLSSAVQRMAKVSAASGQHPDDGNFLDALDFGRPEALHAIPLTARGRGVAVLYADAGNGGSVNVEALETLVHVAGLRVELLAASQPVPASMPAAPEPKGAPEVQTEEAPDPETTGQGQASTLSDAVAAVPEVSTFEQYEIEHTSVQATVPVEDAAAGDAEYSGEVTYEVQPASEQAEDVSAVAAAEVETFQPVVEAAEEVSVTSVEPTTEAETEPVSDFAFSTGDSRDASYEPEAEHVEEIPIVAAPVLMNGNGNGSIQIAEAVVEVATAEPKKSRLSDRNVELPIEVADDERRLHNDARRFARLLVSEIKLYNEQKVTEGRESGDLYDRLRDGIDRSREMYDKRVPPAVASKFDYFHYELVNSLAEGQDAKLGSSYPGASK
jgi:hypothetical protein